MEIRHILILALTILLLDTVNVQAALTVVYVSEYDKDFWALEYDCAKIRQACISVHGEQWFKENICLKRKYCAGALFLSNDNLMELSCSRADAKDLLSLKAVFDYMSTINDTLYISIMGENFEQMFKSSTAFNKYIRNESSACYRSSLSPIGPFLRVGTIPNRYTRNLIMVQVSSFYLNDVAGNWMEYKKKCKEEGYMDIRDWRFDKDKVTDKDIDLYYEYTVAIDKILLKTKPKRIIPIPVYYEYNPNERIVYIRDGNVFIEPAD